MIFYKLLIYKFSYEGKGYETIYLIQVMYESLSDCMVTVVKKLVIANTAHKEIVAKYKGQPNNRPCIYSTQYFGDS